MATRNKAATAARRRTGAREVHVWLEARDAERLDHLGNRWGLASVRDTIVAALKIAEAK